MTPIAPSVAPPLRIAIDGTALLGQRTGIGQLTANLGRALAARDDVSVVAYAIGRAARKELPPRLPAGVRAGTSRFPARFVEPFWKRAAWPPIESWTGPVDVVHGTNYSAPPARAPVVVSVHDLTFLHRPDLVVDDTHAVGPALRVLLDRGATVHVISDFVGAEVRDAFGLPPERVVRAYPGIADTAGGNAAAGRGLAGADRYVLALGQLEPRKNFPALVRAFDAHQRRRRPRARSSPAPTAGPATSSSTPSAPPVTATASDGSATCPTSSAATCSRAPPCSPTRRSTRASVSRRSRRWPPGSRWWRPPAARSRRSSAPPRCSSIRPTPTSSRPGSSRSPTDDTRREAFVTAGRERAAAFDWRTTVNGFVDLYTDLARNR